ncbi:hypothetical protein J2W36_002227 [Variovorax ginsengisoli]|uniref:Uncharacterized protein n=1 Tax=Variovorax ginsengisoli TaxID=363844 RepID=A0ABT9S6J5_9BURK|nr:hypothetical protein [Variovorax ginsengisoli]
MVAFALPSEYWKRYSKPQATAAPWEFRTVALLCVDSYSGLKPLLWMIFSQPCV